METQLELPTPLFSPDTMPYVGPARVLEPVGTRLRLALPDRVVVGSTALAYPYRPEPGDLVLVIAAEETYVIGVLQGRGKTLLHVEGDLELAAGGRLLLRGGREVGVESPRVTLRADRFETSIRLVMERIVESYRWVKGLIQTVAGRTRTVVESSATLHAERIVEKAKKDVNIDGTQIRLG